MSGSSQPDSGRGQIPNFSPLLHRWFVRYLRRYFARNFHAVRTSRRGVSPDLLEGPLIVYTNHPSWWDPIHFALLAGLLVPARRIFGPMDAQALEKYRFFARMGAFGVERDSRRGVLTFVRTSQAILADPEASLWLTAEGRFSDPRGRQLKIKPGLGHLVRRLDSGWVVPLAVEYPFWNERYPEALSLFGDPIPIKNGANGTAAEWTALFEERLEYTMEALGKEATQRDPRLFTTLVQGSVGVGGVYDQWRRVRAWAGGQSFRAAHGDG